MIIEGEVKTEADTFSNYLKNHSEIRSKTVCGKNVNAIENGLINRNDVIKILLSQKQIEQNLLHENVRLETELEIARRQLNLGDGEFRMSKTSVDVKSDEKSSGKIQSCYLQKDEVAQRLMKSTRWVEQQCKSGVIPYIKIKRSVLFDWGEVVKSLDNLSRGGVVRKY